MPVQTEMKYKHNANVFRAWGTLYMFFNCHNFEDVPFGEFMYFVFTGMPVRGTMKAIEVFAVLFTSCGVFVWQFWQLKQTCYEHTAYIYIAKMWMDS